jgi:hypothetical protein
MPGRLIPSLAIAIVATRTLSLADADLPIRNTRYHDPLDDEIARVGGGDAARVR